MAVKLVALGIIEGEGCYFRIGWNVLDGSVVITGFLYYFKIFRNIQMTRMFRVLRPMRTMKFMPAMKVLVPTMTGCLKALAAFWLLLFFYMFIFSMFGLQLF
jgi:voltage-dependent calcium channel L type alpha-1D